MARVLEFLDGPIAAVGNEINTIPKKLNISSLYPNPFNKETTVDFGRVVKATVNIVDIYGKLIESNKVDNTDKYIITGWFHVNDLTLNYNIE